MKALILVGEFGTEMRPLTLSFPTPLIDFANKPIILHQIEALKVIGVTELVLAINYQPPKDLLNFLKDLDTKFGIKITCFEETELLVTGSIALVRDELLEDPEEPFFVLKSNVISEYPLQEMIEFHKGYGGEASITITKVDEPSKYNVVAMVDKFVKKPKLFVSNKINAGISLLNPLF